jgi:hypothetical protein
MKNETSPILKSTLAVFVVAVFAFAVSAALSRVHAQNDDEARSEATPSSYAEFQYATITGSNNVLNVTMLPVITPNGAVFKNLTLQVNVDAAGDVTVEPGSPTVVSAPQILASAFKAGKYAGPSSINSGKNQITVTGPGVVAGGTTVWSLVSSSTPSVCTYPISGTWYVGPLSNNPLAARLKKAGITSTAYSWGVAGNGNGPGGCNPGLNWSNGSILAVSQTGNSITFSSFTSDGSFDKNYPVDQITYTLE